MNNISVRMLREHMDDIPDIPFPEGFGIRNFHFGEGDIWERIQQAAEQFHLIDNNLFIKEFGNNLFEMNDRSFFIIRDDEEIGTITAWWKLNLRNKEWGMIHWVAIYPDYQGKGLAKPAMSVAMKRLKQSHERAMLRTYSRSIAAIKVYLDFGFYPDLETENSQEAWTDVASILIHKTLKEYGF